jgi:hypothetical protein
LESGCGRGLHLSLDRTILAKGYVVLAQDAAAFQTAFGFASFGVFTGKLSNSGEQVRLRNAANATIDDVTYGQGFPWPTAARELGSSMELINPALNNNLAGAWRASGQPVAQMTEQVFVPPISTTWHYRKGTSNPPVQVPAWNQVGFVEDASWLTGQTSIGFGDHGHGQRRERHPGSLSGRRAVELCLLRFRRLPRVGRRVRSGHDGDADLPGVAHVDDARVSIDRERRRCHRQPVREFLRRDTDVGHAGL